MRRQPRPIPPRPRPSPSPFPQDSHPPDDEVASTPGAFAGGVGLTVLIPGSPGHARHLPGIRRHRLAPATPGDFTHPCRQPFRFGPAVCPSVTPACARSTGPPPEPPETNRCRPQTPSGRRWPPPVSPLGTPTPTALRSILTALPGIARRPRPKEPRRAVILGLPRGHAERHNPNRYPVAELPHPPNRRATPEFPRNELTRPLYRRPPAARRVPPHP